MEKDKSSEFNKAINLEVSQIFVPYINLDLENLDREASQASLKIESKLVMNAIRMIYLRMQSLKQILP